MNNMYDILNRFNTVAGSQTLMEGRAVKEADVEEGNRFTGELAKARAAGKKQADLDGDGDMEPVKEAKKTRPDFLDLDKDGDRKEPMKKAIKDRAKKPVKENLRLVKEASLGDRSIRVYHDREYQEYHVCVTEGDHVLSRQFAGSTQEARDLMSSIISEARGTKVAWPGTPEYKEKFGQDRESFRKKFAPSVMKDPKGREELAKLDTEYEAGKKSYGRDEEEDEEGSKKEKPAGEKRGRGRPKKYTADRPRQERVTAKARKADRTAWTPDRKKRKVKEQDMAEGVDIGKEWMSDTELDQYVPDGLQDEWRELVGYDIEGKAHPLWANMTGGYEPDVNDPEDRANMVKVANKWFVMKKIPNVKFYDVKDADDELEWLVQIGQQGMAEDYDQDEYDEEGEMAQSQTSTIADAAMELQDMLTANENLPEWVQKKITLAKDYIDSARDYLKANRPEDSDIAMAEASTGDYSAKKARAGKDIGKPGKQFAKIAKSAGERYGSKERGEKVAGAVLAKLRAKEDVNEADMDESALQAYLGKKKYGKEGMAALQQAGREGAGKEKMAKIRAQHDKLDEEDLEEKAVSKAQRAAAGIAYAAKKGDIPRSELRGASKEMARMPSGELKKFAKTKEKGLPEKVREVDTGEADARRTSPSSKEHNKKVFTKHRERVNKEREDHDKESEEKSVKETTTAGSVATAPAEGGKKSKGGIQFGKGIYEAQLAEQFEREMKSVMNEGLDVSVTANADGSNTVSVTGKDVAPDVLMDLLKMAGMSGSREEVYKPVEMMPGGADSMSGMLDTLDGLAGSDQDMAEPMIPEATVCEVCGGHEGMHEAGCERDMALESDLANSADNTETMSTDYMVNGLSGGLNGPKQQVNPNNMADNPLAMKNLGKAPSGQVNLGAIAEEIEQEDENRLLDLYRKIGK